MYAIAEIEATYLGAGQGMASDLHFAITDVTSLSDELSPLAWCTTTAVVSVAW